MSPRYLLSLSDSAFDAIPERAVPRTVRLRDPSLESPQAIEWIVSGYCEKLLYKNEGLQPLLQTFVHRMDAPECRNSLTQGQRILQSLSALDGQIKNGGICQFFWNCPDLIFEASDALKALNEVELLKLYERALKSLLGKQDSWIELREQSFKDPNNPKWESFAESYDLLDLGWFDDAYFNRLGPALLKRLADYVRSHREEFIEPQR